MDMPIVSVIVPCYNAARYLPVCLDSILNQTFQSFEIVVVNDGSTDDTETIIKPYLNDPHLRYVVQENGGPSKARNTGIAHAKGRYIAFLDSDDLWDKTKLEKQLALFDRPEIGVVYTRVRYIDECGRPVTYEQKNEHLRPREGNITNYLFVDNFVPFSSVMVRKDCLDKIGCFDEELGVAEDWDLLLRLSVRYEFKFVDEPLLQYRFHGNQISSNTEKMILYIEKARQNFISRGYGVVPPSIVRKAQVYTCIQIVYFYRSRDIHKALQYASDAFLMAPWDWGVLRCFMKTAFMTLQHYVKN
jgi:glycosyltransferase involved in cell wall biosynthesis